MECNRSAALIWQSYLTVMAAAVFRATTWHLEIAYQEEIGSLYTLAFWEMLISNRLD